MLEAHTVEGVEGVLERESLSGAVANADCAMDSSCAGRR